MATNPETLYVGKIKPSSADYPYGEAQDITLPSDGTGTPWKASFVNDLFGFQQALLSDAGVVPSGTPDKVGASQYLQSLFKISGLVRDDYTALRLVESNQLSDLTGCFITGDGIGGAFQLDKSDVVSLDNNGTIIVDADGGRWKRRYSGVINAKWFGVTGDSVTDENTAVQAALDYAATVTGATGGGSGASVFFPSGGYVMDNITWPLHVNIIGEETRVVTFFFGGAEAANSTILSSVGQSFAGITGVSLIGYTPTGSDLAESLIRFESGALDLNHAIGDIALKGCKYNAIHQEAGQVVNLHINRIRFDGVGGYGLRLKTFLGHESRPISIDEFTLDNNNSSLPAPYSAEPRWGLGLLRIIDGGHNTAVGGINISNGRLEKNLKYRNTTYGDYTTGEVISSIVLEANATAGAGQHKLDIEDVIVTGTGNIETGEALATCSGYTSSSGATVNARHCSMAASDAFVYVDNHSSFLNLPASVISMSVKTAFEKSVIRAKRSTDQTAIASGGSPKIVEFNSESIDSLSEFDIATNVGRFTPTREGWYKVSAQVLLDAGVDTNLAILYLMKNGAATTSTTHVFSGTGSVSIPFNDIVFMDGDTDYLEMGIYHNTGVNRTLKATNTFVNYERILE